MCADSELFPDEFAQQSKYEHIADTITSLERAHAAAKERTRKHQEYMKRNHDKHVFDQKLTVGMHVYLYSPAVKVGKSPKLHKK